MTKDKKLYFGLIDPPPSGTKRGTEIQALEKNQVRYYGKKQVDPVLLAKRDFGTAKKEQRKLDTLTISFRGLMKRLNKEVGVFHSMKEKGKDTTAQKKKVQQMQKRGKKLQGDIERQKLITKKALDFEEQYKKQKDPPIKKSKLKKIDKMDDKLEEKFKQQDEEFEKLVKYLKKPKFSAKVTTLKPTKGKATVREVKGPKVETASIVTATKQTDGMDLSKMKGSPFVLNSYIKDHLSGTRINRKDFESTFDKRKRFDIQQDLHEARDSVPKLLKVIDEHYDPQNRSTLMEYIELSIKADIKELQQRIDEYKDDKKKGVPPPKHLTRKQLDNKFKTFEEKLNTLKKVFDSSPKKKTKLKKISFDDDLEKLLKKQDEEFEEFMKKKGLSKAVKEDIEDELEEIEDEREKLRADVLEDILEKELIINDDGDFEVQDNTEVIKAINEAKLSSLKIIKCIEKTNVLRDYLQLKNITIKDVQFGDGMSDKERSDIADLISSIKAFDFYETPKKYAIDIYRRVREFWQDEDTSILEPTAGLGGLVIPFAIADWGKIHMNEFNNSFYGHIKCFSDSPKIKVTHHDFLEFNPKKNDFQVVIMNPPFTLRNEKNYYVYFLVKAMLILSKSSYKHEKHIHIIMPKTHFKNGQLLPPQALLKRIYKSFSNDPHIDDVFDKDGKKLSLNIAQITKINDVTGFKTVAKNGKPRDLGFTATQFEIIFF